MVQRPETPKYCSSTVYRVAQELGFGLVGITEARPSDHADAVRQWIADGKHGEMRYLAENLEVRLDPGRLLDDARSVIAVADAYASHGSPPGSDGAPAGPVGRVARYAWGRDYHKTVKKRLHTLADALRAQCGGEFRCVVDTAPALEREHAMRAGLGWTGKHTLLIHPRHGSYFLLGLIVTTLALEASRTPQGGGGGAIGDDHCGTCTRCIDACPTQCIDATAQRGSPRSIDARRCISYLTLEHRSLIEPALHAAMGDWIAGCDVCQEVCPYNRRGSLLPIHVDYAPRPVAEGLPLLDILDWTAQDRQHAFTGSALKRVKLDMLKRNALIALGNHLANTDDPRLEDRILNRIQAIAVDDDEPALVRETARQVLAALEARARPGG